MTPSEITTTVTGLTLEIDELTKRLQGIQTARKAIQDFMCKHAFSRVGSDHNYEYFQCKFCQKQTYEPC